MCNEYICYAQNGEHEVLGILYGETISDALKDSEEWLGKIEDTNSVRIEQLISESQRNAIKLLVASASGEAQSGGVEMEKAIATLRAMSAEW